MKPNHIKYRSGQKEGHYESFFQRANHPSEPLAFWIRYTLFSPKRKPQNALGELWAVFFDGKTKTHIGVKEELPLTNCHLNQKPFELKLGATGFLNETKLDGKASSQENVIQWNLAYSGNERPLYLLPIPF